MVEKLYLRVVALILAFNLILHFPEPIELGLHEHDLALGLVELPPHHIHLVLVPRDSRQ